MRERRWGGRSHDDRRPTSALIALLLVAITVITVDAQAGDRSPVDPARRAVGEVLGPAQQGAATVVRPFTSVPAWFRRKSALQEQVATLEAENARLRQQALTTDLDRNRLAEYDGLTRAAAETGYAMVPARVIAFGPMQSFTRTVTIDAGSDAGVLPDMTVVNNDGLVGRVLRSTRSTATVLLILDAHSVVGARIGSSMEIGFLTGRGVVSKEGRLDLELVDETTVPAFGEVVLTWGSRGGAPYVPGIPIGKVEAIVSNPRETTQRAIITPFVDFAALDLVGVVVPSGSASDRTLIEADGSIG
ncbi:rod shape-determining protein MreC [Nocardioides limicola]|uniref:rod shape-determining protein MreC n=1 Tax=Nocardioides limicola TaxID=2803368 RepID=UPI00193AF26D|nr:rod shape-determining protein MreC [Nocardioides sp. DJM-14]